MLFQYNKKEKEREIQDRVYELPTEELYACTNLDSKKEIRIILNVIVVISLLTKPVVAPMNKIN